MRVKMLVALGVFAIGVGTASARQNGQLYRGFATGFVGGTLGGDVADPVITVGAAVSVQESTGWGTELDLGVANDNNGRGRRADITTLIVGVNWMRPEGPIHPYGTFGVGTIGVHGCLLPCSQVTTTWNLGASVGGGAHYDLNDVASLRGDFRYMFAPGSHANTSRPENFGFFRASFGVTFGWSIQ